VLKNSLLFDSLCLSNSCDVLPPLGVIISCLILLRPYSIGLNFSLLSLFQGIKVYTLSNVFVALRSLYKFCWYCNFLILVFGLNILFLFKSLCLMVVLAPYYNYILCFKPFLIVIFRELEALAAAPFMRFRFELTVRAHSSLTVRYSSTSST
jgi:hypothetical protein